MSELGITDLRHLIQSMKPTVSQETFVFGHIPAKTPTDSQNVLRLLTGLPTQMMYKEDEGWTVVVEQSVAESVKLNSTFPSKKITLNVHSSLDAVGFLAAILTELAKLGIGVNPVSAFFHDHLYVPIGKEDAVMQALQRMASETQ